MKYRPLLCGCDPEYQCSLCANCYACRHIYIPGDVWRVKCPTGRIRIAYPDTAAQERVRILRRLEDIQMGGDKYEGNVRVPDAPAPETGTTTSSPTTDAAVPEAVPVPTDE